MCQTVKRGCQLGNLTCLSQKKGGNKAMRQRCTYNFVLMWDYVALTTRCPSGNTRSHIAHVIRVWCVVIQIHSGSHFKIKYKVVSTTHTRVYIVVPTKRKQISFVRKSNRRSLNQIKMQPGTAHKPYQTTVPKYTVTVSHLSGRTTTSYFTQPQVCHHLSP